MLALQLKPRHAALALAVAAISACTDEPAPTAPRPGVEQLASNLNTASTFIVTSTGTDTFPGMLRWAISKASYGSGHDTIRFDPSLAGQTIPTVNALVTQKRFIMEGPATKGVIIRRTNYGRVFDLAHPESDTVVFKNVTITGGLLGGEYGAAVYTTSNVRFENSTISGNQAGGFPAIYAARAIDLVNTTVSGNVSTSYGVYLPAAVYSITALTLINSTITNNTWGGVGAPLLIMRNSIIANNGGSGPGSCVNSSVIHQGTNIATDATCGDSTVMTIADPVLGPLADNGGPAKTHALLRGSPAINAGSSCSEATDQRYVGRDAKCDVGAFEFTDFVNVALTVNAGAQVDPSTGWALVTGTIKCTDNASMDIAVDLKQTQKNGRLPTVVQGKDTLHVDCTTAVAPWSISVAPTGGTFQQGSAALSVGTANLPAWIVPNTVVKTAKLSWARK